LLTYIALLGGSISQVGNDVVIQANTDEGLVNATLQNFQLENLDEDDFIFAPAPTGPLFLSGGPGPDILIGGAFNDTLQGNDGDDIIFTAGGTDLATGGAGNDIFVLDVRPSPPNTSAGNFDVVTDFTHGADKLDFGPIDTNPVLAGDQGFAFIGSGAFSGTGAAQIRVFTLNGNTVVSADLDGNRTVDMLVQLNGIVTLDAGDFIL